MMGIYLGAGFIRSAINAFIGTCLLLTIVRLVKTLKELCIDPESLSAHPLGWCCTYCGLRRTVCEPRARRARTAPLRRVGGMERCT
jgi:hypothetical protein